VRQLINIGSSLKYDEKELKKAYEQALCNNDFRLLCEKLKISEDILMKYTSFLTESALEFNNCMNCKGLGECKNSLLGHAYLPRVINDMLEFNYKKCNYQKKQDKLYNYQNNIVYYNVSKENKLADFSKIDKRILGRQEAILWLNNFIENYPNVDKGLYLSGNTGCGKTYMVIAAINELAKKNVKCAIAFWPDFLRNLKSSFDTDYEDKINYLINVPVLLIDDLGGESSTPWARDEVLFPILQGRLDDKAKVTFITSNLDKDLLYEHLSLSKQGVEVVKAERIMSRINSLTYYISCLSKDFRNK
jgi:primosomal protein DnaI